MPDTKFRPIPEMTPDKIQQFWSMVAIGKEDECWPFLGYCDKKMGYGLFLTEKETGTTKSRRLAHRIAFYLHNGYDSPICVLHTCDFGPCCNPNHFFEGTRADNNQDKYEKGRCHTGPVSSHKHAKGENHTSAKLTTEQVREIRQRAANGETHKSLSIEFGIAHRNISKIVHRENWKHVT